MPEKVRKEILKRMQAVREAIGQGHPMIVMKEKKIAGDWLKGVEQQEGKTQEYMRGYYDGLQAALEIMDTFKEVSRNVESGIDQKD